MPAEPQQRCASWIGRTTSKPSAPSPFSTWRAAAARACRVHGGWNADAFQPSGGQGCTPSPAPPQRGGSRAALAARRRSRAAARRGRASARRRAALLGVVGFEAQRMAVLAHRHAAAGRVHDDRLDLAGGHLGPPGVEVARISPSARSWSLRCRRIAPQQPASGATRVGCRRRRARARSRLLMFGSSAAGRSRQQQHLARVRGSASGAHRPGARAGSLALIGRRKERADPLAGLHVGPKRDEVSPSFSATAERLLAGRARHPGVDHRRRPISTRVPYRRPEGQVRLAVAAGQAPVRCSWVARVNRSRTRAAAESGNSGRAGRRGSSPSSW